jgi:hypothetical protein
VLFFAESVAIPLNVTPSALQTTPAEILVTNNAEIASGRMTRVRAGPMWTGLLIWIKAR